VTGRRTAISPSYVADGSRRTCETHIPAACWRTTRDTRNTWNTLDRLHALILCRTAWITWPSRRRSHAVVIRGPAWLDWSSRGPRHNALVVCSAAWSRGSSWCSRREQTACQWATCSAGHRESSAGTRAACSTRCKQGSYSRTACATRDRKPCLEPRPSSSTWCEQGSYSCAACTTRSSDRRTARSSPEVRLRATTCAKIVVPQMRRCLHDPHNSLAAIDCTNLIYWRHLTAPPSPALHPAALSQALAAPCLCPRGFAVGTAVFLAPTTSSRVVA